MQVGSVSFAAWFFCLFVCFFRIHVIDISKILEIRQKSCPHENFAAHDIYLGLSQNKNETGKEPIARGAKGG